MKKHFLLLLVFCSAIAASAQSRGLKVAYIDMEYILEKVPDYAEAKNQLEQKAQKWKQEIETKKNDITKLKDNLKTERVLLTKELIQEREEEIAYQENELMTYQDKRFGPKGDMISQKAVLVKPIQDQVFNAIQDISEAKKLDFVFDKSSDMTMLYAAKRHDISDQVIRRLTRAAKREQLSGRELKQLEKQEAQEDLEDDPDFQDKKKIQEDKKAARQKLIEDRKAEAQKRRDEQIAKREQEKKEREARKAGAKPATSIQQPANATQNNSNLESEDNDSPNVNRPASVPGTNPTAKTQPVQGENSNQIKTTASPVPEEGEKSSIDRQKNAQEERQRKLDERKQAAEDRKKAADERKQKILDERAADKKAREEKKNNKSEEENKNEN